VQRSACAPVPSLFSKKTLTIRINEKLSWLELRQRAQDAIPMFDCRHTAPGRSLKVINLMRAALEEAWAQLEHEVQQRTSKVALAKRILRAASAGERAPARLRAAALGNVGILYH